MKNLHLILLLLFLPCLLFTSCELTHPEEDVPVPTTKISSNPISTATAPTLPLNWSAVKIGNAVTLGKRVYARSGSSVSDYVQIADLASGAMVKLRQGNSNVASATTPSPTFTRKLLAGVTGTSWYWTTYASTKSFSMTNLQFFNFSTGVVSFPLKNDATVISCGSYNNENNAKRKLGINGATITVADYSNTSNTYANVVANLISPTVVVGLHPNVSKSPNSLIGRTYLAYKGNNLIIYTSPKATQAQVRSILQTEFGVLDANIIMFDGSASTQMVCKGTKYLTSPENRPIPSVIEILEY